MNENIPEGEVKAPQVDFTAAANLEPKAITADRRGKYRFFLNRKSGNVWKVLAHLRTERPDGRADLAPTVRVLIVSVSPVGEDAKAKRDAEGRALVSETFTHTITDRDLMEAGEDFDWRDAAMHAVCRAVAAMENRLAAEAGQREIEDMLGLTPEPSASTTEETR